jgi:hypothetical protein
MNKTALYLLSLLVLAACTTAKEDTGNARVTTASQASTVVECILYDGMTKQSAQLTSLSAETQVQVLDTVDVYFVKARVMKDGQVLNGYMYRSCFGKQ